MAGNDITRSAYSEITLRLFTPADLSDITKLDRRVYGSGAYSQYVFRQLYDLFPRLIWVVEQDKMLVAHICGAVSQDNEVGWILNFAVQGHFRRLGVGRRLMQRVRDELVATGVQRVRTTVEPENAAAFRLCEKLNFEHAGVEDDYYGDGMERAIMEYTVPQEE